MKQSRYRLGDLIITEYDMSLFNWETHVALGEQHGGNCYLVRDILIIGPSNHVEAGYLILEFHEHLMKLPGWDKTPYYCFASTLHDVVTGHSFSDEDFRQKVEAIKCKLESSRVHESGYYRSDQYKIIVEENNTISWQTYRDTDAIVNGQCVIESGILFIDSKETISHESLSRKEWNNDLKLLPIWDQTGAWSHLSALISCSEKRELKKTGSLLGRLMRKPYEGTNKNASAATPTPQKERGFNIITQNNTKQSKKHGRLSEQGKDRGQRLALLRKIGSRLKRSVILNDVLPFIVWFVLLVIAVISIDFLLHQFRLRWIGRYLGIPGLAALLVSFLYTLRKHSFIKTGSMKGFLSFHVYLAWLGALLIMVHAGIHFNALLPWSAFTLMLIVVVSGLVGEYLLKQARKTLDIKYEYLLEQGYSKEQVASKVFLDALTVKTMTKWRHVHKPLTMLFGTLAVLHIITIFMFWRWFT